MSRSHGYLKLLLSSVLIIMINAECPNIITKMQWGGRANRDVNYLTVPIQNVIIEHTVSNECDTQSECSDRVRSIQNYHMDDLNYHDIGYNFLVGGDGNIYEGVGWHRVGAHTYGWNSKSIGIAFIGNFSDKTPRLAALDAVKKLLDCGVEQGKLDTRYNLLGHRQVLSTQSPGQALYQEITTWSHFARNPPK